HFSCDRCVAHRDLLSFPTRRSSDLLRVRRAADGEEHAVAFDRLAAIGAHAGTFLRRTRGGDARAEGERDALLLERALRFLREAGDRKSTRLNSSHLGISYAVFCLKK